MFVELQVTYVIYINGNTLDNAVKLVGFFDSNCEQPPSHCFSKFTNLIHPHPKIFVAKHQFCNSNITKTICTVAHGPIKPVFSSANYHCFFMCVDRGYATDKFPCKSPIKTPYFQIHGVPTLSVLGKYNKPNVGSHIYSNAKTCGNNNNMDSIEASCGNTEDTIQCHTGSDSKESLVLTPFDTVHTRLDELEVA